MENKDNNLKPFRMRALAIIIILAVLIITITYLIYTQYVDYQEKRNEQDSLNKSLQESVELQSEEIGELRKENELFKDQTSSKLEKSSFSAQNNDLPKLIKEWQPRIVLVICDFQYSNGKTYQVLQGSGMLVRWGTGGYSVLTNKHIIEDGEGYMPVYCNLVFLGSDNEYIILNQNIRRDPWLDLGLIDISVPDSYISSLISGKNKICPNKVSVGTEIVILGYPIVGSPSGITATEGIISGHDGDYYITSAKVEQGNSGGAAISLENNCYMGIPSYVEVGGIESLARILSTQAIFVGDVTDF